MTGDQLRAAALTLFPRWGAQSRLAERLRLDGSTMSRYLADKLPIPGIVEVAVDLLLREHGRRKRRAS